MPDARDGWTSEFDTPVSAETEWTAANIQEALPGLVTPMSWSLIAPLLNYGFARPAQRMGSYVRPRDPFVAQFYSRAYLNATALRDGAKRIPGASPEAIDEQYLGRQRDPDTPPWKPSWSDLKAYIPVLPRMALLMLRSGDEIASTERQLAQLQEQDSWLDFAAMTPAELLAELDRGLLIGREVAGLHIGVSGGASATFESLGKLARDWLNDTNGVLQSTLVTGLATVESATPSRALWDLSRLAMDAPEVSAALAATDAGMALDALRRSEAHGAGRFVAAYDAFLSRFGHRSVLEGELSAPLWEEDPGTVFAMLRNLRDTGPEASPYLVLARQRDLREHATAASLDALPRPRRDVFERVLALAQGYVADRERTKSMLVKGTQRARKLVRELGRRFAADGLMDSPDDIFMLPLEEAKALVAAATAEDLRDRIARRRAELARNRAVALPEAFVGRPLPEIAPSIEPATVLRGIPVSPGIVSGIARVILDPRVDGGLAQGEILVAPVTDAGWTPLFLTAAAVVVDIGGPLSHGATVARELGLPAVVNVKQGTRLIRSGQRITVDGAAGTVTLEPESV